MRTKREIEMEQMQKTLAQIDLIARDAIEHGGHEEDIDIGVFMLAMKKAGKPVKWKHKDVAGSSVIRTYPMNSKGKRFSGEEIGALFKACEEVGVFA